MSSRELAEMLAGADIRERIADALGGQMDGRTFISQMLISLADPDYASCTTHSKFLVLHQCASMALLPSLDQVALIVRDTAIKLPGGGTKKEKRLTCMPQWQGYKAIMERNPELLDVRPSLIHKLDRWEVSFGELTQHDFAPFDEKRQFNSFEDLVGGYVRVLFCNGRPPLYHFASKSYIKKCQGCAATNTIWNAWFEQMLLKTCLRSAFARRVVPMDPLVARQAKVATELDDAILENDPRRPAKRVRLLEAKPAELESQPAEPDDIATEQAELFETTPDAVEGGM